MTSRKNDKQADLDDLNDYNRNLLSRRSFWPDRALNGVLKLASRSSMRPTLSSIA